MKKHIFPLFLLILLVACNTKDVQPDGYGHFEADDSFISSELPGKLISVKFKEGDVIKTGDTLAIVDTSSLSVKMIGFEAQEAAILSKINVLKAQKRVFESELAGLENEFERVLRLKEEGAATKQQYEKLEYQLLTARSQLATFPSQISAVYHEVEVVKSQSLLIRDQISKATICAASDGTVLEKYLSLGELVVPGKPILKMANMVDMYLRAYVSGNQLSSIALGQIVTIRIDASGGEYKELSGEVSWIANQSEFTPKIIQTKEERVNLVYAIKIKVKNTGELKIGMPGELILN
ncbi:MAG: HlyD family efflux transporter periplasmic adaptor subunit [Bacteroidales bacterium]|nr:HlyD family efflux transporter periplasmic adaptor subunit [Bacteroidales bacterium]